MLFIKENDIKLSFILPNNFSEIFLVLCQHSMAIIKYPGVSKGLETRNEAHLYQIMVPTNSAGHLLIICWAASTSVANIYSSLTVPDHLLLFDCKYCFIALVHLRPGQLCPTPKDAQGNTWLL
jgi:hypothetical protein